MSLLVADVLLPTSDGAMHMSKAGSKLGKSGFRVPCSVVSLLIRTGGEHS
jgi:hypothetical protein